MIYAQVLEKESLTEQDEHDRSCPVPRSELNIHSWWEGADVFFTVTLAFHFNFPIDNRDLRLTDSHSSSKLHPFPSFFVS